MLGDCPAAGGGKPVDANTITDFGLRLFSKLCTQAPAETIILSPLVVAGALSLSAAGATPGSTAAAELGALGLGSFADFAALSDRVLSGEGASVRAANGVFARAALKPEYVALVKSHGAEAGQYGSSYAPVNAWVSDKTEGLVKHLLNDPPDPLDVAVLVSAVVFKGSWAAKFDPARTAAATFTAVDGRTHPAQLMHRVGSMAASRSVGSLGGAAALRLDYGSEGAAYCALLVLPRDAGPEGLAATVTALTTAAPLQVLAELRSQRVRLALPKLKAAYGSASLKAALRTVGLAAVFDGDGGFLGLSDDPLVHIADVVTKAVLEVDEEGTVAAAAAAAVFMTRSAPAKPLELTFDRPFVMAILHVPTGAPLFLAQIHDGLQ